MTAPIRNPAGLVAAGLAPPERLAGLETVAAQYAVAITPAMAELIDAAEPCDPIARQFVPSEAELIASPGESADPIGDEAHSPVEGVVHRYPDRCLLKITQTCAVYCRFCFRRETVGPGKSALTSAQLDAALAYIAADPAIWEVIVTGGDPFVLSPRRLTDLMRRLGAVEHVKVVRFHTRVPSVDPGRVTPELVAALKAAPGKAVWVALHANHASELTDEARAACARLVDAGVPMVSQTVLLAGVNDDAETLSALMRAFVETRIKPYYLHHGDYAPGSGHLRTTMAAGQAVMKAMRGDLSGLAQPTYVLDIPGGHGKVPIGPDYLSDGAVEDPWGETRPYPPAP